MLRKDRAFEESTGYLLRRAHVAARAAFDVALADYKITAPQFDVLHSLYYKPGQSSADLTRRSTMTAQAVNLIVRSLERRKLLRRVPHPAHGRILQAELTAAGCRLLEQCLPRTRMIEHRILGGLDEAAERIVRAWLVELPRKLDPADSGNEADMSTERASRTARRAV